MEHNYLITALWSLQQYFTNSHNSLWNNSLSLSHTQQQLAAHQTKSSTIIHFTSPVHNATKEIDNSRYIDFCIHGNHIT